MTPMRIGSWLAVALALALSVSVSATRADRSALNGTYRVRITDGDLRAGGVSARYFRENRGIFTWMLSNGRWRFTQHAVDTAFTVPWAPYTISGDRATFVFRVPGAPRGAPPPLTFRWKLADDHLRFTLVRGEDPYRILPVLFTAHPWRKIG